MRTLALWLADDAGQIDMEAARRMVRGYAQRVEVDATTLPEVVEYVWWQKLTDLWILGEHYLRANTTADDLAARTLGWLRWLATHRGALAAALVEEVSGGAGSPG
jgi:hypothetical protein